ncbi:MAG: hypothetical protein ACI909_003652 [Planctomycetota bacterium]|jgi:hypothetical protein
MTVEILRGALAWSAVINYVLLLIWFLIFLFAHDWMYGLHSKWFSLSVDKFDAIHYTTMAFFKLSIFLLYLAPYLALRIVA